MEKTCGGNMWGERVESMWIVERVVERTHSSQTSLSTPSCSQLLREVDAGGGL